MSMSLAWLRVRVREPGAELELPTVLVAAMCNPTPDLTSEDRAAFEIEIERLLDHLAMSVRSALAEKLAARPDAPCRAVTRLAGDAAVIAAPLLARSPVLGDDDLAALAQHKSGEHRLAIALRGSLSERITDILIAFGEPPVLEAIAENPGARFSAFGVNALVDRARSSEALWQKLAGRPDLPAEDGDGRTPAPARPLAELADLLADRKLALSEAVIELADADRVADLAALVCRRVSMDVHDFLHYLFAPDETALMEACRDAQLDLESFSAIMRLRHRRRPRGAGDIGRMLRAFRALSEETVRIQSGD